MTFYQNIAPIYHLSQISNADYYHDVPKEWLVALTDVRGSTQAMQDGRQKDVNAVAAASIAAILNIAKDADLPFVFGGDGATVLIPPDLRDAAKSALQATRIMARNAFDLDLRVGIVPVRDVLVEGYPLRVAKFYVSENFQQAIFSGGGLSHAEFLLKHPVRGMFYAVDDGDGEADFSGFECRWNAIPSTHDETVSLIVMATNDHPDITYKNVLDVIERIYGERSWRHPISVENMKLAMNLSKLSVESRVRYGTKSLWRRLKILRGSLLAAFAMRFGIGEWHRYKPAFLYSTDHEKFDDTLRMTISGTPKNRESLLDYLHEQRLAGDLVFGLNVSDHTLVTCIVFDYFGKQVHFVDAGDGGYTAAARQMKKQLEGRQATTVPRVS